MFSLGRGDCLRSFVDVVGEFQSNGFHGEEGAVRFEGDDDFLIWRHWK
jgi:hypothetical protein